MEEEGKLMKCVGDEGKQDVRTVRMEEESLLLFYSITALPAVLYGISDRIRFWGQEELE